MAYTDVISLSNAKDYLGIDDTSRDTEISRMIKSALQYIEKQTNIIMDATDRVYILNNGCKRVYDYPINTLDSDLDSSFTVTRKGLYSIYETSDTSIVDVILNVGYVHDYEEDYKVSDIESDLIEAAYMLIEHFFNEGDRTAIPQSVNVILGMHKRFIL